MLRYPGYACAIFVMLSGTAAAQSAFPFWEGGAIVDSVSAQCNTAGFISAKSFLKSTFRAKVGVAGEPNSPGITFMDMRSDQAFFRTSGGNANTMNGAGACGGYLIRPNVTTIPNPNTQQFACTYNFDVEPATITKQTQTVTIDGWVNNWRGVAGCKVTFRAAYRLNPN